MGCQYRISKFIQVEEEAEDKVEHLRKEIELLENEMNQLPNEFVAALQEVKEKERPCQKNAKLSELELELQCCSCQEVCRPPACIYQVKKTRFSVKKVTENQVKKGSLSSNQLNVNAFLIYHSARCFKSSLALQCPEGDLICGQCLPPKVFFFIFSIFFIFFPPKVVQKLIFSHLTYHLVNDCDCNI